MAAISSFTGRQRQPSPDISEYILKLLEQTGITNPETDYGRLAEIAAEKSLPGMWETTKETVGDIGKAAQWMYDTPVVGQIAAGVEGLDKTRRVLPEIVDVVSEQPGEVADAIKGGLRESFYERGAGGVAGLEDVLPFGMAMGMAGKVPKLVKTLGAAKMGDKVTPDLSGDELSTLARAQFGRTDDPGLAGYILDDGDMLDFSEGSGMRGLDHRAISSLETGAGDDALVDVMNSPGSAMGYMVDFMNRTNAIRMNVGSGKSVSFEMAGDPSRMQQVKMRKIMKQIDADHAVFEFVDNEGRRIRSAEVDMPQGYHLEAFLDPDPDDLEDYGMTILDNMGDPMSREAIEALSTPEVSSDVPELVQTLGRGGGRDVTYGTHEQVPGEGTGHLSGIVESSEDVRRRYTEDSPDWSDEEGDIIYQALGQDVQPSQKSTGYFKGPEGLEINPGEVSVTKQTTIDTPEGPTLTEKSQQTLGAGEAARGYMDAQNMAAWHKVYPLGKNPTDLQIANATSFRVEGVPRPLTSDEIKEIDDLLDNYKDVGDFGISDTGDGFTVMNFGDTDPKVMRQIAKELGPKFEQMFPESQRIETVKLVSDAKLIDEDFGGLMGSKYEGTGSATRSLEEALTQPEIPDAIVRIDADPRIAERARAKLEADEKFATENNLPIREDIQRARQIISESGFQGLFDALKNGAVLPAIGLAVLSSEMDE